MSLLENKIIHASVFFVIASLFLIFIFLPSLKKINTDFPNYYVSANMLLDGKDMVTAYDNVKFNKEVLLYGIENQFASFVPYPPVNALILLPFARLNPLTAKSFWNILNLFFFLLCIYFISKITGLNFFLTGILFFISGYAFVNNFFFGQMYLLILLLFSSSIFCLLKDREMFAALLFSLSVVIKFYTIFFLILFLCKKRFKLVFSSVILILLLNFIIILITGWDINLFYYSEILPRISDGWVGTVYAAEFQSVLSLLHSWFYFEPSLNPNPIVDSPQLYFIFKYLFYFGILISSVFVVLNSNKNALLMQVSMFCFICMLLLPVNASYQYIILIPAIAIMIKYYLVEKKYLLIVITVILFFMMNSPVAVLLINVTKNQPCFFLGYIKLFILIYFWITNLIILKSIGFDKTSLNSTLRYSFVYVILVLIFSKMALALNNEKDDGSKNILVSRGYLLSTPAALGGSLIFTESRNDKFILNSNFGLKYDKENIFDPVFINNNEIVYSTFVEKQKYFKKLFVNSLRDTMIPDFNYGLHNKYSKDKTLMCFSNDGQIFLRNVTRNETTQLTSGNSFNVMPVFAENDSKIIFCSDRRRGVGFTTLYEIKIEN